MLEDSKSTDNELVTLARGVSMIILGAGLVLSNPNVRRFLMNQLAGKFSESDDSLQGLTPASCPNLERLHENPIHVASDHRAPNTSWMPGRAASSRKCAQTGILASFGHNPTDRDSAVFRLA